MTEKATGWRKREIMELALEALLVNCGGNTEGIGKEAITAIKEDLAQPEQEKPVVNGWSVFNTCVEVWGDLSLTDAVAELTPERLQRGWSAVCVINKDNPFLYTTPPAAPVQERTDYAVHLNHCNMGECYGVCKYGDDDCPALKHTDMKAKWDRSTPPNVATLPAAPVHDIDWEDLYEKEKRRSEMWIAKYEKDIGLLERAGPVAAPVQEPVGYVAENGVVDWNVCAPPMLTELFIAPPAAQREWVGLTPHERMMCRSYDVDETIAKTEDKLKEKNT